MDGKRHVTRPVQPAIHRIDRHSWIGHNVSADCRQPSLTVANEAQNAIVNVGESSADALRRRHEWQEESMGDVMFILWLPLTIAFMAVAFVVTLSAAGDPSSAETTGLARPRVSRPDDRAL